MLNPAIAVGLRRQEVDAVSALELGHVSMPDEAHLLFAAEAGHCLVTRDYGDFVRHTRDFSRQALPHAGVLLVPNSLFSRDFGPIQRALSQLAAAHPEDLPPYTILCLSIGAAG
jgi:hypothetical protein